jgi:hypothetical protein
MNKGAWLEKSGKYRCIECDEPLISLFITYGEPSTFEYPLLCPRHWRKNVTSAIEWILERVTADIGKEQARALVLDLLDFIIQYEVAQAQK